MVEDVGDVNIFLFAIRHWILYFQKVQLTEEPVQTKPFTSKCCKSVFFFFFLFKCVLNLFSISRPILSLLLSHIEFLISQLMLYKWTGNAFPVCVRMNREMGSYSLKSYILLRNILRHLLSFTPLRTGDHRHSNREAAAGVWLVGSRPSPQLPRWPPHGPGVVPAMW